MPLAPRTPAHRKTHVSGDSTPKGLYLSLSLSLSSSLPSSLLLLHTTTLISYKIDRFERSGDFPREFLPTFLRISSDSLNLLPTTIERQIENRPPLPTIPLFLIPKIIPTNKASKWILTTNPALFS
jgi:hypothetical protein